MKAAINTLVAVVIAGATMSHAASIPLFNTGVDATGAQLALGASDPHWTIVSGPGISSPVQAVVVNQQHPIGRYTESPFSLWIGVNSGGGGIGQYTLRLRFDLTGLDPTTAVITGVWGADGGGFIRLNGLDSGIGTGTLSLSEGPLDNFNAFHSFTLNQGFLPTTNTLDFIMINGTSYAGLNVTSLGCTANVVVPATIVGNPQSVTIPPGTTATFTVNATGTAPLTYQWNKDGLPLADGGNVSGARSNVLTLANVQLADGGQYTVVVTNTAGSVTSAVAVLTVAFSHVARATAIVVNGFMVQANITDQGWGYTNTPSVRIIGGGGSGAQSVAVVSNGMVTAVNILNPGAGYTNTPLVVIEPPFIPNPVLGIAPMSFLAFSNLTVGGVYQLQRSVGWYWTNQPVSFTAAEVSYTKMVAGVAGSGDYRLALNPVPAQAFATSIVYYGFVVGATVTSGGSGYITSPAISIVGGGGTNATAVSHISADGVVTSITITDAGIGYTNKPTIQIAAPPAAAVSPEVQSVMRVDAASLAPYNNYQIQFKPVLGGAWGNWSGGLFTPTGVTNSQYLFITDSAGFFRLQHAP